MPVQQHVCRISNWQRLVLNASHFDNQFRVIERLGRRSCVWHSHCHDIFWTQRLRGEGTSQGRIDSPGQSDYRAVKSRPGRLTVDETSDDLSSEGGIDFQFDLV